MILNETPVRTSKNFNINNIELKKLEVPTNIGKFNNRSIYIKSEKETLLVAESIENSEILNDLYEDNRVLITEIVDEDFNIKYGVDKEIVKVSANNSNQPIKIVSKEGSQGASLNIDFTFDEENISLYDTIEIYAEKDSNINIIINYINAENFKNPCIHNGIIKVKALENSKVSVTVVNMLNNTSNNLISYESNVLDNANLDFIIVDFGGKNSISNYYSNLIGNKSNNTLNTIYLGNEEQLFDLNYIVECNGEKSNVNIDVQGALNDKATKHFKGTIDFKKGCKKATGNENENCLLLSDNAKSMALPMLLCSEEDVEGNHSTSSGKAGAKELFYLMSRGLSEKDAMKLLVRARFNRIIENITNKEIQEQVLNAIENKM